MSIRNEHRGVNGCMNGRLSSLPDSPRYMMHPFLLWFHTIDLSEIRNSSLATHSSCLYTVICLCDKLLHMKFLECVRSSFHVDG